MEEAVIHMFFADVLSQPIKRFSKGAKLGDLAPDRKFEKEFVDMYVDRVQSVFGVSIKALKNKPVSDILKFLVLRKKDDAKYGKRPFKK
jgi:hypothetical protein